MVPRSIASVAASIVFCLFGAVATVGQSITLSLQDAYPTSEPVIGTQLRTLSVNTRGATAQLSEPRHLGEPAQNSLWGRFTAASNGLYTLQASTTDGRRLRVAVYTNSTLATLGLVADGAIDSSMPGLQWEAHAGETYSIAFDSTNTTAINLSSRFDQFYLRSDRRSRRLAPGETIQVEAVSTSDVQPAGPINFAVVGGFVRENGSLISSNFATRTAPPWTATYTNTTGGVIQLTARDEVLRTSAPFLLSMEGTGDMFADAIQIPASFSYFSTYANVGLAGVEGGETLPLRQNWNGAPGTLWYYFKPAFSGRTRIRSLPYNIWGVYAGNPLGQTPIATGLSDVQFDAVAGQDYYLQFLVGGEPQTRTFNFIWITRETLNVLPPANARIIGDTARAFASATPVARLVVTNLNANDELVDVRLGDHVADGLTAQGNPYFDIDVTAGSSVTPVGTNQAGIRLTGPAIHVGHITNDTPATAALLPVEPEQIQLRYATGAPSDPPELGGPDTPTAWWKYTATEDGFAEFVPRVIGDRPLHVGVFSRDGDRAVPLARTNVVPPAFPVRSGQTYLLGVGSTSASVEIPPVSMHGVRWVGLPSRLRSDRPAPVRLEAVGSFEGSVHEVRWNGSVVAQTPALPFEFDLGGAGDGLVRLEVEYAQTGFDNRRTLVLSIPVFPAYDDFDGASEIWFDSTRAASEIGIPSAINATRESGEPDPSGLGLPSIWYRFTPTLGGVYRLTPLDGVPTPREIVVVTGANVANSHEVVRTLDRTSPVEFTAIAGVTYRISFSSDRAFGLRLEWVPTNDAFSMAVPLFLISSDYPWNPELAGAEAGEPEHGGAPASRSYWWSLRLDADRVIEIPVTGPMSEQGLIGPRIAVYEGDRLDSLVRVPFERLGGPPLEAISWRVSANRTYMLAVDSQVAFKLGPPVLKTIIWDDSTQLPMVGQRFTFRFTDLDPSLGRPSFRFQTSSGTVQGSNLVWNWTPAANGPQVVHAFYERGTNNGAFTRHFEVRPTNDAFSSALPVVMGNEGNFEMFGSFWGATGEPGEPAQVGGGSRATLWYQWAAQQSDVYEIAGLSPDLFGFEIFEGATLANLVPVPIASSGNGTFKFDAVARRVYRIALHSLNGDPLQAYAVRIFRSASNDIFANRRPITTFDRIIPFTLWGSTPDVGQWEQRKNVWFEYLPTTNGTITVGMTSVSGIGCRVYRGDVISTLEPLDAPPTFLLPRPWVVVPVSAGEKIQIELFSENAPIPQSHAFFFLPAGDPAGSGSDLIASRAPLPVGRAMQGIIFPWTFLEPFETASLPSEHLPTLWWSYQAETRGRLTLRASATNHLSISIQPTLAAAMVQSDGSLSPLFNLPPGELMALDLEAGQQVAIRLAGQVDYRANLSSSWGAIPERPQAVIEPVSQAPGEVRLRFVPVMGQPYTILTAPSLNGPWARYLFIDRANSQIMDIPAYPGTNAAVYFRITSP